MRNAMVACALAATSGAAAADWVMANASAAANVYVDPATVLRTGDRSTMMELSDYKLVPDAAHPYKSVKRSYQFDCQEGALRALSIVMYSEPMGQGEVVLVVDEPAQWLLFVPGTAGEMLWKIACRRAGRT